MWTAKPRNDAYTGLLFISFLALVASCIFLYLDYDQYGKSSPQFKPEIKAGGSTGSLPEPSAAPPPMGEPMMGETPPMPAPMPGPMNPGPPMPMNPGVPMPNKPGGASLDPKGGSNSTTTSDAVELPPLSPPPKSGSGR